MSNFSMLMTSLHATGEGSFSVVIPENWMQGRTTYGGLSAALCLQAVYERQAGLPSLRSAQITFIGPSGGNMSIRTRTLRQGKAVSFIGAEMFSDRGLATSAIFCFGARRDSKLDHNFMPAPSVREPEGAEVYLPPGLGPTFVENYEHRLAAGARPLSTSEETEHYIWVRHKDDSANGSVALLALADVPPPAILPTLSELPPISSMSWMLNFLDPNPRTHDGWWLVRTSAEHAVEGYSNQDMTVWNHERNAVITARQNVAVFY